jgi:hypothetical protein
MASSAGASAAIDVTNGVSRHQRWQLALNSGGNANGVAAAGAGANISGISSIMGSGGRRGETSNQ